MIVVNLLFIRLLDNYNIALWFAILTRLAGLSALAFVTPGPPPGHA
jgi:hypothetical protein